MELLDIGYAINIYICMNNEITIAKIMKLEYYELERNIYYGEENT